MDWHGLHLWNQALWQVWEHLKTPKYKRFSKYELLQPLQNPLF